MMSIFLFQFPILFILGGCERESEPAQVHSHIDLATASSETNPEFIGTRQIPGADPAGQIQGEWMYALCLAFCFCSYKWF